MSIFSFTIPTRIEYGIDATARLGHFTSSLGDRVIVITENVLSQSQAVQHIESVLKGKGIEALVYDGVFPNAESNTVDEIAQLARKSRVNVVVGIGGTRICSIAKLVSFLCKNEGEMADYMHGKEGNGKRVPYIEIPTTFREVYALTDSAFITDAFDQVNKVLSSTRTSVRRPFNERTLLT
ncbi:MAG TPA: iron-containing alcohol dehydrogenase [Spirochaetes bacterium]|nr:iron-containing alcohol dehydrogenase [Spirochaetota bacterium]